MSRPDLDHHHTIQHLETIRSSYRSKEARRSIDRELEILKGPDGLLRHPSDTLNAVNTADLTESLFMDHARRLREARKAREAEAQANRKSIRLVHSTN